MTNNKSFWYISEIGSTLENQYADHKGGRSSRYAGPQGSNSENDKLVRPASTPREVTGTQKKNPLSLHFCFKN